MVGDAGTGGELWRQRGGPRRSDIEKAWASRATTNSGNASKRSRERKVTALVVAEPPRTLADLRHAFHADVKSRIIAEVGKALTNDGAVGRLNCVDTRLESVV